MTSISLASAMTWLLVTIMPLRIDDEARAERGRAPRLHLAVGHAVALQEFLELVVELSAGRQLVGPALLHLGGGNVDDGGRHLRGEIGERVRRDAGEGGRRKSEQAGEGGGEQFHVGSHLFGFGGGLWALPEAELKKRKKSACGDSTKRAPPPFSAAS